MGGLGWVDGGPALTDHGWRATPGGSYERLAIEDYLTRNTVSPVTGRRMLPSDLTVNRRHPPPPPPPQGARTPSPAPPPGGPGLTRITDSDR